jgi:HTH-type transcriptional regulator/antitoxin HipB
VSQKPPRPTSVVRSAAFPADTLIHGPGALAALIRSRREALGLSQQAVADAIGVSRKFIVDLEHGKPSAEIGLALRAVAAVGIDIIARVR